MKQRVRRRLMALTVAVMTALPAVARADDTTPPKSYDGRLEGYDHSVTLDTSGAALTWFLLVGLGVVCIGVLFKDAKRSHLD